MSSYRLLATACVLGAALVLGGCADKDPSSPLHSMETGKARTCLAAPLDTTKIIDDKTLLLVDALGHGEVAHMSGSCMLDSTSPVLMKYHGTTTICGPLDVDISGTVTGGIPTPCIVASMEPVSKAQVQAYMTAK